MGDRLANHRPFQSAEKRTLSIPLAVSIVQQTGELNFENQIIACWSADCPRLGGDRSQKVPAFWRIGAHATLCDSNKWHCAPILCLRDGIAVSAARPRSMHLWKSAGSHWDRDGALPGSLRARKRSPGRLSPPPRIPAERARRRGLVGFVGAARVAVASARALQQRPGHQEADRELQVFRRRVAHPERAQAILCHRVLGRPGDRLASARLSICGVP